MSNLDPEVLWEIEEFSVLEDKDVMLTRVRSSRLLAHSTAPDRPDLLPWACAIGEGIRYSFGHSPREAWAGALARHREGD